MPASFTESTAFRTPLLRAVCGAFLARRKALRHTFLAIELRCEPGQDEPETQRETLCIDAEGANDRYALRVWPHGEVWYWVGRPAKHGWQYQAAIRGQLPEALPHTLVRLFEDSKLAPYNAGTGPQLASILMGIWAEIDPVVETTA